MRWSKLIPLGILLAVLVDYVLIRPALLATIPHLAILEFPLGAALIAALIGVALRRRARERPPEPPAWRRHEQVVRPLPDPAARAYAAPLARWLETGESASQAAAVLARAASADEAAQESLRAKLSRELSAKSSRKKRESVLKQHLEPGA